MARPTKGAVVCTKQANGLTSYAIRITAYRKRHFVTLGTEEDGWTPARAELERQRIAEAVKAGVWQPPQPRSQPVAAATPEPAVAPTFQEVATAFVRRKSLILAPNTINDLRWRLTDHLLPYFAAMRLDEIGDDAFFGYLETKLQQRDSILAGQAGGRPLVDDRGIPLRPLSNTSINMTLATLAAVLDEPECEPWVTRNPARGKGKRLKTYREKGNFLEADELNALLDAAERLDLRHGPAEDKAVRARELRAGGWTLQQIADELGTTLSTAHYYVERRRERESADRPLLRLGAVAILGLAGPRVTEAAELRRMDIDLRRSTLNIADAKTPTGIRVINLSPLLVQILTRVYASVALKSDSPALPSASGTYRDRHNLARLLDGVVAEANRERARADLPKLPPDVTPHTLRRTYVSLLLEARAPIPYVMQQIGHKDQKTVLEIYARVLQRQGREEVGAAFDRLIEGSAR